MDKSAFDRFFDDEVAQPLGAIGFKKIGKSLARVDPLNTVILMRLGGKASLPGTLAHVLCFRHSFLRNFDGVVPATPPDNPHEYPFKFCPSEIAGIGPSEWRYQPRNLNYDYDRFQWSDRSNSDVTQWLRALAEFLIGRFIPWTDAMTPQKVQFQLAQFGEQAWCERQWCEDYARHLAAGR